MPQVLLNGVLTDLTDEEYDEQILGNTVTNLRSALYNRVTYEMNRRIALIMPTIDLLALLAAMVQIHNSEIAGLKASPPTIYSLNANELTTITTATDTNTAIASVKTKAGLINADIAATSDKAVLKAYDVENSVLWA
jgi:hypothetical protein